MNQRPERVPTFRERSEHLMDTLSSDQARTVMLLIITIGVLGFILVQAQAVLTAILFALTVGVVVSPLADQLERFGIPRLAVASALLVLTSVLIFLAFVLLEPLLTSMVYRLPEITAEVEVWIESASGLIRGLEVLSEQIEATVGADSEESEAPELPTVMDALWLAPNLASSGLIFIGTLIFFVLPEKSSIRPRGDTSVYCFGPSRRWRSILPPSLWSTLRWASRRLW